MVPLQSGGMTSLRAEYVPIYEYDTGYGFFVFFCWGCYSIFSVPRVSICAKWVLS